MPHDVDEEEIEAALRGKMPSPYCETNWRQAVGGIAAVAAIVLGLSIEQYMVHQANGGWVTAALGGAKATSPAIAAAAQPVPQAPQAAVMPVALTLPSQGSVDPNFRLVQRTERTAFNFAATTVRPAVVGVRALLAQVPGRPRIERVGSGVILDPSGHIVTCHHVVAGSTAININLHRSSGPPLSARIVAVDNDLALLKVDGAPPLPVARLADSSNARVGDWVIAVGHPFGLGLTVTAGIIGQRHGALQIPGGRAYTGLFQTDAPINEGSSGGPLVDMQGQVVGLNTAIYAPTGVFSGAGFAIPSNVVAAFVARHVPLFSQLRGRQLVETKG